jgi:LemA protein
MGRDRTPGTGRYLRYCDLQRACFAKTQCFQGLVQLDVLLKQRPDELPKLVEVCKQYMGYERETLEKVGADRSSVAAAREGQHVQKLGAAETQLRLGLGNLFALAEAYPDLKANANFVRLQERITSLENTTADRREYYNESVNLNDVRIEQFPDVVIARWLSFPHFELLEFGAEEKSDIELKSLFAPS